MNKIEKALVFYREKLNVQKNIDDNHPCIARTLIVMVYVLEDENPNESLKHYEQAVSILRWLLST